MSQRVSVSVSESVSQSVSQSIVNITILFLCYFIITKECFYEFIHIHITECIIFSQIIVLTRLYAVNNSNNKNTKIKVQITHIDHSSSEVKISSAH